VCVAHSILANPWLFWPPRPTLLTCPDYLADVNFSKQAQWGADEWRAYANYLEERGAALVNELAKKAAELEQARRKASRRTKPIKYRKGSLLTGFEEEPKPKRGRKKNEKLPSWEYAELALKKQKELRAQGRIVTDSQALEAVYDDLGLSRRAAQRPNRKQSRNICNRISELRNQNNSKR
jgi:hypothetical protein